jgi:hypothetical protein
MLMTRSLSAFPLAFLLLLLLTGTSSVYALPIVNGGAVGANYTIQGIDAGVAMDFMAHAPAGVNNNTIGKLTMVTSHMTYDWLGFSLKQNAPAAANSAASGGLRLLLDVIDTNGMQVPWDEYKIRAVDKAAPANPGGQGNHLGIAHFHDTTAGFKGDPLVLKGEGDNVIQLNFGLGALVMPGNKFTATNILLHERDYQGMQREFRVETRVPEPGTLSMSLLGICALFALRRRIDQSHSS